MFRATTEWIALFGSLWFFSISDASPSRPLLRRRDVQGKNSSLDNSTRSNNRLTPRPDEPNAPFTIIFVSDLENKYRGHNIARSQYVVNYIRDLKNEEIRFDGNYSNVLVDPKLVIHGGDVSHMWSCDQFEWFVLGGCRDYKDEYKDVWDALYEAGIPMISSFGNHDWRGRNGTGNIWGGDQAKEEPRNEEADYINYWSNEFVRTSYKKSQELLGVAGFQYEEVKPTGRFGPSMFRATFAGVQIANFNAAYNWQSYDDGGVYSAEDQFNRFSKTLDRSIKTLFFSHYNLRNDFLEELGKPSLEDAKRLIREFGENTHHFSGHIHTQFIRKYNDTEPIFNDYTAPYPHNWRGAEPGFYAILMSPVTGILQVKVINIPGLEAGDRCVPFGYLNTRQFFFGLRPEENGLPDATRKELNGKEEAVEQEKSTADERIGELLERDVGCAACKSGKREWSAERNCFVCQAQG